MLKHSCEICWVTWAIERCSYALPSHDQFQFIMVISQMVIVYNAVLRN